MNKIMNAVGVLALTGLAGATGCGARVNVDHDSDTIVIPAGLEAVCNVQEDGTLVIGSKNHINVVCGIDDSSGPIPVGSSIEEQQASGKSSINATYTCPFSSEYHSIWAEAHNAMGIRCNTEVQVFFDDASVLVDHDEADRRMRVFQVTDASDGNIQTFVNVQCPPGKLESFTLGYAPASEKVKEYCY